MPKALVVEMKFDMDKYTAEIFLPYAGTVFVFESSDLARQRAQLELLEVKQENSGARPAGLRSPFSLLFALRSGQPSAQSLHRILHDDFEPVDWFLTRVLVPGRDPGLAYYEAVFG